MRRWLVALVALAIAGAVAFWFATSSNDAPAAAHGDSREAAAAPSTPNAEPAPIASTETPARGEVRAAPEPVAEPASESAPALAQPAPAQDGLAELRGRFVLPNGAPAVGVALTLHGWQANQERVLKYGMSKDWPDDIKGASDADGRFSFRFDPPPAFQFALDAKLNGYGDVSWRWGELPPHEVTDIGEITLAVSGSIRGRLVDKSGKPVPGQWQIYAESAARPSTSGGDRTSVNTSVDRVSGQFVLDGLPPGSAQLKAYSHIANWIQGPSVEVRAGEVTEADIVYDGPDNSRRIVVGTSSRPFYIFDEPAPGSIKLLAGGATRTATKIPGSSESWSFEDLDPGSYTVAIDDPTFRPWSKSGISPGQSVNAHLEGSAAVQLAVTDPDGAAVDAFRLRIRFRFPDNQQFSPDTFELRAEGAPAPASGVYDGLIPTDFALIVDAPGFSTREVNVDALAPKETRAIAVKLSRGSTVSGVVLEAGKPVADMPVALRTFVAEATQSEEFSAYVAASHRAKTSERMTRSDASGRFEFQGVPDGTFALHARRNRLSRALLEPIECPGATTGLQLEFPPTGMLVGRLLAPDGASFEHLAIDVRRADGDDKSNPFAFHTEALESATDAALGSLDASGAFRCGPLPAGEYDVELTTGKFTIEMDFNSSMGVEGPRLDIGHAVIAAGRDTTSDFDVRASFPGWAQIEVTLNGAPGAGLGVQASSESFVGGTIAGQLDSAGMIKLGPLFPAAWSLRVTPVGGAWTWNAPAPIKITPGAVVALRYDIQQH